MLSLYQTPKRRASILKNDDSSAGVLGHTLPFSNVSFLDNRGWVFRLQPFAIEGIYKPIREL